MSSTLVAIKDLDSMFTLWKAGLIRNSQGGEWAAPIESIVEYWRGMGEEAWEALKYQAFVFVEEDA